MALGLVCTLYEQPFSKLRPGTLSIDFNLACVYNWQKSGSNWSDPVTGQAPFHQF